MLEYEEKVEEWLRQLGWSENPFTLKISPSLFVGYNEEIKKMAIHLREGHKVAMVLGSTGSGKTTFLRYVEDKVKDEYKTLYIAKPPQTDELVDLFLNSFKPSIIERILGRGVKLHDLHVYLNRKLKGRKFLLMIDEAHESDVSTLEWLRTICDQVEGMQMILAGLPTLEDLLRKNLETLRSRIVTKIELVTLNKEYTRELIRRRIESVGGRDILPFTDDVVDEIYKRTGGFPREVLKMCNDLVQKAIEKGEFEITCVESDINKNVRVQEQESAEAATIESETIERQEKELVDKDFLRQLTYKQRKIVDILQEREELYPSEIVELLGFDKYKSKQHAVRSINNILNRLMSMGVVDRKPKGKGFVYFLDVKARTLLTRK